MRLATIEKKNENFDNINSSIDASVPVLLLESSWKVGEK